MQTHDQQNNVRPHTTTGRLYDTMKYSDSDLAGSNDSRPDKHVPDNVCHSRKTKRLMLNLTL